MLILATNLMLTSGILNAQIWRLIGLASSPPKGAAGSTDSHHLWLGKKFMDRGALRMGKRTRMATVVIAASALLGIATILILRVTLPFNGSSPPWNLLKFVEEYVGPDTEADKAAVIQAQIQAAAVLVQVLGGIFLVGALYSGFRTLRVTQKQLAIAYEGQITERFTRAIEQLGGSDENGNPRLEIRLGGIYALERIAKDSPPDSGPIMEVLTAYVRLNAPAPNNLGSDQSGINSQSNPKPTSDIQAILTVIGRRTKDQRESTVFRLDLSRTDLRGAMIAKDAHFEEVIFTLSRMEGAILEGVHLQGASLAGVILEEATLTRAHLEKADLSMSKLGNAFFNDAHLEGAILTGVKGLTQAQIDTTFMDEGTVLPQELDLEGKILRLSQK